MNVDTIPDTMNSRNVAYLLIGVMNFLLRHAPVMTYDVDLFSSRPARGGEQV